MSNLMQASRQWASRPDDERFLSLLALDAHCAQQRAISAGKVVSSRKLQIVPIEGDEIKGLEVHGPNGVGYAPTHWSFGQLAQLAGAPAGYLRTLPAALTADAINYGLRFNRELEEVGVLLRRNGTNELAAATGPRYGRVWNAEITRQLVDRFGDGVSGDWRVPGEFGKAVEISKANTTFYASDRDMFVFLADETNRVAISDRRNGQGGSLARGFFVWNSETGSTSIGVAMFLFDYACSNRIVWGARDFREIKLRHSVTAPDRWAEEITPLLRDYSSSSAKPIEDTLKAAQAQKVDDMASFRAARKFSRGVASKIMGAFESEEGRKPETLWDATTAITAYAKGVTYQDERVSLEREGGRILDLVAVR